VSYENLVKRFKKPSSTGSRLKDDVLTNDEFTSGIGSLFDQTRSISEPLRSDDGISGERFAIIFKSLDLDGPHQIQDPGVMDVISSNPNIGSVFVKLHFGIAAGTTGITMGTDTTDTTRMSRFYELYNDVSQSPVTDRNGHTAKVEMLGVNHGLIVSFTEDAGNLEVTPRTGNEKPTKPQQQEENNQSLSPEPPTTSLDYYLERVEHKSYQIVKTAVKSDVNGNPLCEIHLNGVALKENRRGQKQTLLATEESFRKLIEMEKIWDKLRIIYGHHNGNMNAYFPGLVESVINAYRDRKTNAPKDQGGRDGKPSSKHLQGIAFDVARGPGGLNWVRLFVEAGFESGFTSFGIGPTVCHADHRAQFASWSYEKAGPADKYAPLEFVITPRSGIKRVFGVVRNGQTVTNKDEIAKFLPEWEQAFK